jgi:polysaccharide export outer membrane protein
MTVRLLTAACIGTLLVGLPGKLSAQSNAAAPISVAAATLKPGDLIKLMVWREEDLTGDLLVPESGIVVFPKIGPVKVTGIPKAVLRDSLIRALGTYLRNPAVEVLFQHRITVQGHVRKPGIYHVDGTHSLADVLALAEGADQNGKPDEVRLIRGSKTIVGGLTRGTRIGDLPLESGDQLYVPQRGWLERNTPLVAALVSGVVSVAVAILVQK